MSTTFAPRPEVGQAQPWSFPTPTIFTLPNGIQVRHFDLPGQRIVSVRLHSPAAVGVEPSGLEGLADIVASAVLEGPIGTDTATFAEDLDCEGADVGSDADDDGLYLSLTAPVTRLAGALRLLGAAVTAPRFEEDDIDRLVDSRLDEIHVSGTELGTIAANALNRVYFPLERRESVPTIGTSASVSQITADDVAAFWAEHVNPAHATIIVGGDLRAQDCSDLLIEAFGAWQGGPQRRPEAQQPVRQAAGGVFAVDVPDSVQTRLMLAAQTPTRSDPRWCALELATHALGGSMESLLNLRMREERGYTYGVNATLTATEQVARLSISTSVDRVATAMAAQDLFEVVRTWSTQGLSAQDHARAQDELTSGEVLEVETARALTSAALDVECSGQGLDWPGRRTRQILAADGDTVRTALGALDLDEAVFVLVGDLESWRADVEQALGTSVTVIPGEPDEPEDLDDDPDSDAPDDDARPSSVSPLPTKDLP